MAKESLRAEVTGSVFTIDAAPGDNVKAGATLLVLESMKMEIPIVTPVDGTVAEILVGAGDSVEEGQILVVVES